MSLDTPSRRSFLALGAAAAAAAVLPGRRAHAAPAAGAARDVWTSIVLTGTNGQAVTLSEIPAPVVMVHLWASWCAACLGELPAVESFAGRVSGAETAVLLVSHPKHWEADQAFLQRRGIRVPAYTVAADTPWDLRSAAFGMTGGSFALPQTLAFAGRERRCVMVHEGAANWRSPQFAARLEPWRKAA